MEDYKIEDYLKNMNVAFTTGNYDALQQISSVATALVAYRNSKISELLAANLSATATQLKEVNKTLTESTSRIIKSHEGLAKSQDFHSWAMLIFTAVMAVATVMQVILPMFSK
jgi:hypothetical protein